MADSFRCSLCGLSDRGAERLQAAGFPVRPCRVCADHFEKEKN